ncbi:hypothetical protein D3C75_1353630 [compost metagenome]
MALAMLCATTVQANENQYRCVAIYTDSSIPDGFRQVVETLTKNSREGAEANMALRHSEAAIVRCFDLPSAKK